MDTTIPTPKANEANSNDDANDGLVRYRGTDYDHSSQTQHQQGQHLLDLIDYENHQDVLDVGCGNGRTTLELWNRNRDMSITAIDVSGTQIATARDHWKHQDEGNVAGQHHGGIVFKVLDATEMGFHDKFDLVFSNAALHWVPEHMLAYSSLYDALKPGGVLAVHQGGHETYRGLHANARKAIDNLGLTDRYLGWTFPAWYPEPDAMTDMLHSIGFTDIMVDSVETDGSEHLVENFAVASLIYYQNASITAAEYQSLVREFKRICREDGVDLYTHRLFITARKSKPAS